MTSVSAPAKINLALVVGPQRADGKHEVVTVLQRVDLADTVTLVPGHGLRITGFEGDTLVARALELLAAEAGEPPDWHVRIDKRIPVAAGLGGGSSDAAAALTLANGTLERPLPVSELVALAAAIGADVPFFLARGPQLGSGDGSRLAPVELPTGYHVLLVLPEGAAKPSTAAVYEAFDRRRGDEGFDERREALLAALGSVTNARAFGGLPPNDLASSSLAGELEALGAFRADVSGAGPTVYGLFERDADARGAQTSLRRLGETWICAPTWYG